jgi:hypothetical protein
VGCDPQGIAAARTGIVALGRCGGRSVAAHLTEHGGAVVVHDPATASAECIDGRPSLVLRSPAGAVELPLIGKEDRFEAFLPTELLAPGARAAFTGEVVLVARPTSGMVSLARYACHGGRLIRS